MITKTVRHLPVLLAFLFGSCNSQSLNENTIVSIKTSMGDIKVKLYDNTPGHRDNFIKLIKSNYYEGISFHRVIKDFMIQAGDPETKKASGATVADSLIDYTIPAEFNKENFHKKGALAAARQGNEINPSMRSSGTQFYIVHGKILNDEQLNSSEKRITSAIKQAQYIKYIKETYDSLKTVKPEATESEIQESATVKMFRYLSTAQDYKIPENQRQVYKNIGGTPFLDATYTVFGEVTEGLDVVERISSTATNSSDKPLTEVKILKIKISNK